MHRITIEKNEAVADLIERILEVEAQEITLVVPKGSRLTDSPSNFRLIAREANVLSKDIAIESVDQDVLAMAKAAGLTANHPLFGGKSRMAENQSFSDIVLRGAKKRSIGGKKLNVRPEPELESEEDDAEDDEIPENETSVVAETDTVETEAYMEAEESYDDRGQERYDTLEEPRRGRKWLGWGIVLLLLIAGGMWLTAAAFGRATVTIAFQKSPWNYDGTITAAVAAKNFDPNTATVPAELVEQAQTLPSKSFPATGRTTGGQKAKGTITIVNAYSGASQELVATTRFTAPDGKIFRLDNGVVVPGATVGADGKVTASSSIKAAVTADQSGPDYNLGAVAHLNIPGFQGTAKYTGFYGILAEGTSGGSSTGGVSPTDADIKSAKDQMASALSSALQATFLATVSPDFKVLPGAVVFSTTTFSIGAVDGQGQFSVTPSSVFHAFEFREVDVNDLLKAKAQNESSGKLLQDLTVDYTNVSPNFSKKQMTFTVSAKGVLVPQFESTSFAASIAGKSQEEARQAILTLPDLVDAKVSLWPRWLWSLPKNSSKITIKVQ